MQMGWEKNLMGPQPLMKNYRQLMLTEKRKLVLFIQYQTISPKTVYIPATLIGSSILYLYIYSYLCVKKGIIILKKRQYIGKGGKWYNYMLIKNKII